MTQQLRDVLQILRFELNYLEQGGFERDRVSLGTESPFRGTFVCINFDDPLRAHACHECPLYQFVPQERRTKEFPCHHIPLNDSGETVAEFIERQDPVRMVPVLENWLRTTITKLEAPLDRNGEQ
jgi:hypothetical protein